MTDGMTDEAKKWRGWAIIWFLAFLITFIGLMYLGYQCNGLSGLGLG